jgi:hypothetical protein
MVFTRTTRRNNPEDTILHSHRRENLKSYPITLFILMARAWIATIEGIWIFNRIWCILWCIAWCPMSRSSVFWYRLLTAVHVPLVSRTVSVPSPQNLCNSNPLTVSSIICTYNITVRTAQKILFLCCSNIVAVYWWMSSGTLYRVALEPMFRSNISTGT